MILTMNNFVFNNENYLQQHGTAMGTKMAPAFANLFMGDFEEKAIENHADKPPTFRFIAILMPSLALSSAKPEP